MGVQRPLVSFIFGVVEGAGISIQTHEISDAHSCPHCSRRHNTPRHFVKRSWIAVELFILFCSVANLSRNTKSSGMSARISNSNLLEWMRSGCKDHGSVFHSGLARMVGLCRTMAAKMMDDRV